VNVVNGGENVLTFVCRSVSAHRHDVIIVMTSLHHQQVV